MLSASKAHDPDLVAHEDHLRYRTEQFARTLRALEEAEGSLEEFARGASKFGLTRGDDGASLVFREWAPAAVEALLLADFNEWKGTPLQRDRYGVWSCVIPDIVVDDGISSSSSSSSSSKSRPAIAHGQRYRLRLRHPGGWWVDVVPAWATRCVLRDPGVMGSRYDAERWDPPEEERHVWKNARPTPMMTTTTTTNVENERRRRRQRRRNKNYPPPSLRIYEAHVGMSSEEPAVASYSYFTAEVLPRIARAGYNAVQLMAVAEHAYYGSFGYHVTSPFAVSSRCGTPEDLKELVDAAHGLGLLVILDVVHSHASSNEEDGIAGLDLGGARLASDGRRREGDDQNRTTSAVSDPSASYFAQGAAGRHEAWDSRLFAYGNWETLRYLLSNLRFWVEEYRFDGFRFDGVTSMLYHHHGLGVGFSGGKSQYFSPSTNVDAVVYLMLANTLVHRLLPPRRSGVVSSSSAAAAAAAASSSDIVADDAADDDDDKNGIINDDDFRAGGGITIAEDVSGMPGLCRPVSEGGVGFDARLGMGLPDLWARLLGSVDNGDGTPDERWDAAAIVAALCNRARGEKTIAYAESHDQSLVGDVPIAWRLMGARMYDSMAVEFEEREVEVDEEEEEEGEEEEEEEEKDEVQKTATSKKKKNKKKKTKIVTLVPLPARDPTVARGVALHKVIRALTASLGGDAGWLSFMGNEFGHPEWVDFPREGNGWSHERARRQWSLVQGGDSEGDEGEGGGGGDDDDGGEEKEKRPLLLRYSQLAWWDELLMSLDERFGFMGAEHLLVSHAGVGIGEQQRGSSSSSGGGGGGGDGSGRKKNEKDQVIVAERGPLVFVFNLSADVDREGYKIGVPEGGKYRVVADSDAVEFGGRGLLGWSWRWKGGGGGGGGRRGARRRTGEEEEDEETSTSTGSGGGEYFSTPEGVPGVPETNFNNRAHSIMVCAPARSAVVYARVEE